MAEQPPRPKQAACLVCRRSKIKCDWMPYEAKCRRCIHLNCECIRPEFHPGRQKGIKKQAPKPIMNFLIEAMTAVLTRQ
jgi:hypothetical protein